MDCGPAALKCLLEGHGIRAAYGRLREACQTEVDGTSIDTLEVVARQLGLEADQMMLPVDHVVLPAAGALPALVIVRRPDGNAHFIILWRQIGRWVQVMDPAVGRRWITIEQFRTEVFVHQVAIEAPTWEQWARGGDLEIALRSRLGAIGLGRRGSELFKSASEKAGWLPLAALDAAARMTAAIVSAGGLARGREAEALLVALLEDPISTIPETYWHARPAGKDESGTELIALTGAVLIHVAGVREEKAEAPLPPELAAALTEPAPRPERELWKHVVADGKITIAALGAALVLAAASRILEALLFRGLIDLTRELGLLSSRLAGLAMLAIFLVAVLALELPMASVLLRLGRHLEARIRVAILTKIPRIGDRYFASRPVSDMAERAHSAHVLRQVPELATGFLRSSLELVATTAGIIWLDPESAHWALAAALACFALPLVAQPILLERDLRLRTHAGGLGRFYLDALLGLMPVRTHGAEQSLRHEHEGLLVEWARAARELLRVSVLVEGFQLLVGMGLAGGLLVSYLYRVKDPAGGLLLAYWALALPGLGQELSLSLRQYPRIRSATLRLLEPLGALEDPLASLDARVRAPQKGAASIRFDGVSVHAAGHTILEGVDLEIDPGQHVGIVGPSGAGKSSFVGLLLGWHRPSSGRIFVDSEPLDPAGLLQLRAETAWVDPAVQLWNRTLLDNLRYADRERHAPLAEVIDLAHLRSLLEHLPSGLSTKLGEGGSLVSGGEGQRVRFGRALSKGRARLVILDEPFRGLDRKTRRSLLASARRFWSDATLLVVTHDISDTLDLDRVIVVEGGRVVENDAPSRLERASRSRYRALLDAESEVHSGLWESAGWRRWTVREGGVVEGRASSEEAVP
jgi:ABC-type bacteriocin/lantibiotic exporter with double-glycine peptidase domain